MNLAAGAICGGARFVYWAEPAEERWCFGERKRRTGIWMWSGDAPADEPSWYEPVWIYRCDGCGKDRRELGS